MREDGAPAAAGAGPAAGPGARAASGAGSGPAGAGAPAPGSAAAPAEASPLAESEPIATSFRVRYVETDAMGIVHHSNHLAWFEAGRTEWLRARGLSYRALEEQGFRLAITDVEVRYLAPARYDDLVTITTRLEERTRVTLRFAYEVEREGALLCRGRTRLACIDAGGRPRRLPEALVAHVNARPG